MIFIYYIASIALMYCFSCSEEFSIKPTKKKVGATLFLAGLLGIILYQYCLLGGLL